MNKVIIYNQDNNVPAVLTPTDEALQQYGILAIAIKDVPYGKQFKIVDVADLPLNTPQEAWRIDNALLTDGVGGESNEFEQQVAE